MPLNIENFLEDVTMNRLRLILALAIIINVSSPAYSAGICESLFEIQNQSEAQNRTNDIDLIEKVLATEYTYKESIADGLSKIIRAKNISAKLIPDPQQGLLAKRLILSRAKYTADLVYYIFERDMSGYTILNELKKAISRGVDVRLAIDSAGSMHPMHGELKALIKYAEDNAGFRHDPNDYSKILPLKAKLEIIMLNPVNPFSILFQASANLLRRFKNLTSGKSDQVELYKNWGNRRFHNKSIIVDVAHSELVVAMDGGRNIGDDYYGVDDKTFHDMEMMITNSQSLPSWRSQNRNDIGPELAKYYNDLVYHLGNRTLTRNIIDKAIGAKKHLNLMVSHTANLDKREDFAQKYATMQSPETDFMAPHTFYNAKWTLLHAMQNVLRHNVIRNPDIEKNAANHELLNFSDIMRHVKHRVVKAKNRIRIVSPYIYFEADEVAYLKNMLIKNPSLEIEIVTNSIMTSDNMMAQAFVDELVGPEFDGTPRVSLYEYGRLDDSKLGGTGHYGKLHAKYVIVDDQYTIGGTFNGDKRSRDLNSENMSSSVSLQLASDWIHEFDILKSQSTLFGSPENLAIRNSAKLGKVKRFISAHQLELYNLLRRLGMTWLI
jgi:putative cardiolipin synthase